MGEVTRVLEAAKGDPAALRDLFPLVYEELRRLAEMKLTAEPAGHTLQPTALVHEVYLRLLGNEDQPFENRRHFFGAAAEAMRRILVDSARRRCRQKRGGKLNRQDVQADELPAPEQAEELLEVSEALDSLQAVDPMAAEVVKLRYFGGLTVAETAQVLEVAPRTIDRLWSYARAWLHRKIATDSKTPVP